MRSRAEVLRQYHVIRSSEGHSPVFVVKSLSLYKMR